MGAGLDAILANMRALDQRIARWTDACTWSNRTCEREGGVRGFAQSRRHPLPLSPRVRAKWKEEYFNLAPL
jgi:hypothetical protein